MNNKWVNPNPKPKPEFLDVPNLSKDWEFYLKQVDKEKITNIPKKERIALFGMRISPSK